MSGKAEWFSQSPSNAHWPKEPLHGWAPGSYSCTCRDCGMKYMGDKRSFQCYGCAKKFVPPPRPETPEEIRANRDRLAAELARVRRNHLRRMLHDIPSANQRSQIYAYHHAEAMTTARIIAIDDRLCRLAKAIRAALAQPQDGTTGGRG